jgi:diphthamide biosynthesis protein 3
LQEDLLNGEDIASCPSCSLKIRVIYDPDELEEKYAKEEEGEKATAAVEAN